MIAPLGNVTNYSHVTLPRRTTNQGANALVAMVGDAMKRGENVLGDRGRSTATQARLRYGVSAGSSA